MASGHDDLFTGGALRVSVRLNVVRLPIAPPTFASPWKAVQAVLAVSKGVVESDTRAVPPCSSSDR